MGERLIKTGAGIVLWVRSMTASELANELKSRKLNHFGGLEMLRHRLLNYEVSRLPKNQETPPEHSNSTLRSLSQKVSDEVISEKNMKEIRSWGLFFGNRNNLDAGKFLAKIEEMREGTNVRDQDLMDALPFLLVASSNLWYRLEHFRWKTWEDFCTSLRQKKFYYREITAETEQQYSFKNKIPNKGPNEGRTKY